MRTFDPERVVVSLVSERKTSQEFKGRRTRAFRTRKKDRVTGTRALDGNALVAILRKDDWVGMIRLFLALKPWTLTAGFVCNRA